MSLTKAEQNIGVIISFFAILLFSVYLIFSTIGFNNEMILLPLLGCAFIGMIAFCIILVKKLRKENRSVEIDYLNVGVQRHLLGLFMIFYGLPKLFGTFFDYQLFALDSKLRDVSEFELAWYFYGKNRWQEVFAGVMELVPGLLLLNRRTYYIGALILLPVTGQVFILNFFFKIGGITFPAALILLACNLYIIYSEKEKILMFLRSLDFKRKVQFGRTGSILVKLGRWTIITLAVLVLFRNVKRNFLKGSDEYNYEKLIGVYSLESVFRNGRAYTPVNDSLIYKDLYIEKQSRWNILRRDNGETNAFVMNLNPQNDSIHLYINKGGIGDDRDILDSLTVFKGIYKLEDDRLTMKGEQSDSLLQLNYRRQAIDPKAWFW